jgi:two-component system, NarL family, response regulator LiaR
MGMTAIAEHDHFHGLKITRAGSEPHAVSFSLFTDNYVMALGFDALANEDPELRFLGAASPEDGIESLEGGRPDVLVIDQDSDGVDAATVCEAIARRWPSVAVMVIADLAEDGVVRASLEAGARGFICKSTGSEYLRTAIRLLGEGHGALDPKVTLRVIDWAKQSELEVVRDELSEREIEVLRLVSRGEPNKRIAKQLGLTENTVKTYLRRAYKKLNCTNRSAAAAAVAQRGLI